MVRDDLTSTIGNFTGDEKIGGNWTDKIMAAKVSVDDKPSQEPSEIEDDEWVRKYIVEVEFRIRELNFSFS